MNRIRNVIKPISPVLVAIFVLTWLPAPAVHAGLVSTAAVLESAQVEHKRAQVLAQLQRAEVQAGLVARGVDTAQIEQRVAALTDSEINALAERLDELPAGGTDVLGAILLIFLVLLITDILGFTDVFPFVKKTAR